jgi:hypothetical protein
MTIDPSALYFPSLAAASRSIARNTGGPLAKIYDSIYPHIHSMTGAIQTGKNCHWKVPVAGLLALGYSPTFSDARPLANLLDEERRQESGETATPEPAPEPEIVPAPEEYMAIDDAPPTPRSAVASRVLRELEDEFASLHHLLASKDLEIARLRAERDAARDRAAASEEHLRDLRSILDYATSPNQK